MGSSVNLKVRFRNYYSRKILLHSLKKAKSHIHFALLKYGYSEFRLEILEYCNKKITKEREQYYLDNLVHEYNILQTATSN